MKAKETFKRYALLHVKSGELVGFSARGNGDAEDCCDVSYELETRCDNVWLAENAVHAEWVRRNSTEWFCAGYDTPTNRFKPDDLRVVLFEAVVTATCGEADALRLPTFDEWADVMYAGEPRPRDMMKAKNAKNPGTYRYSLYDLRAYYHKLGLDRDGVTPVGEISRPDGADPEDDVAVATIAKQALERAANERHD
jgi:hypothetical protein